METERVLIVRRRHFERAWCHECGREVEMVGLKETAALTGMTQRLQGYAGIEKWHFSQAPDGSPVICLDSLLGSI